MYIGLAQQWSKVSLRWLIFKKSCLRKILAIKDLAFYKLDHQKAIQPCYLFQVPWFIIIIIVIIGAIIEISLRKEKLMKDIFGALDDAVICGFFTISYIANQTIHSIQILKLFYTLSLLVSLVSCYVSFYQLWGIRIILLPFFFDQQEVQLQYVSLPR